jgi:hypothetical protein
LSWIDDSSTFFPHTNKLLNLISETQTRKESITHEAPKNLGGGVFKPNLVKLVVPGVPEIVAFIDKNIEPLIFLGFFGFVKTIKPLITQKKLRHKHKISARA